VAYVIGARRATIKRYLVFMATLRSAPH